MTKIQRIWMWIFIAMFALPEILFLNTPLFILSFTNNFSETNIIAPIYSLVDSHFFNNNPGYLLLEIAIEWVGMLGLFMISIKSKNTVLAILLGIILLWLSLIFYFSIAVINMHLVL